MPGHPDVESEASRFVKVRAIDLGALVRHAREQVGELGYVILKMDIQVAEYHILMHFTTAKHLCMYDLILYLPHF